MNFNPALQGLRGLAALSVLLFHWNGTFHVLGTRLKDISFLGTHWDLFFFVRYGWVGVDWFFVLSGFLLAGTLWHQPIDAPRIRHFWRRRFLRIYPALWVHIMGLLAVLWFLGRQGDYLNWHQFLTNMALWVAPLPGGGARYNAVFWTLPIELMFYLSLPFLVLLYRKVGIWAFLALTAGISVAWRLGVVWAGANGSTILTAELAGTTLPGTLFLFCAGVAINHFTLRLSNAWRYGLLAAFALLYYGWFRLLLTLRDVVGRSDWPMLNWDLGLIVIIAVMLALLVKPLPGMGWLGSRPLVWLGDISYGIYLWHFPVLRLMPKLFPGTFVTAVDCLYALAWCLAITLALASASYYGIERPLMNWRPAPKRPLATP